MPIPLLPGGFGHGRAVDLGALSFNQEPDANGVEWWLEELTGWDSPNLREDLDDRPLAHGAYRGASYYGARELTLSGHLASDHGSDALGAAMELLAFETDLTEQDAFLVVHEATAKQLAVRRAGTPRMAFIGEHTVRFEVDVTAADPRKYGLVERNVTLSGGESDSAPNTGNFRSGAPLLITFTGAGTLLVGGRPVIALGPVDIDTLEGTALVGGATAYARLGAGSTFPQLPARASTPLSFSGPGSVTVTWRDAWV